jgi:DNA-directed RNA polymerase specialized sigma24 family protein
MLESRDEAAPFGEIFDRHAEAIFRYLARRIGPDDASDLLADVFLAAFEARFLQATIWLHLSGDCGTLFQATIRLHKEPP